MAIARSLFRPPSMLQPLGVGAGDPVAQLEARAREYRERMRQVNPWFVASGPKRNYPERTLDASGQPVSAFAYSPPGYPQLPSIYLPTPLRQPLTAAANWIEGGAQAGAQGVQQAPGMGARGVGSAYLQGQGMLGGQGQQLGLVQQQPWAGAQAPATAGGNVRDFGQAAPPEQLRTALQGMGGGGGAGGTQYQQGPNWVEERYPGWYAAFQGEHEGQRPEEFYMGQPFGSLEDEERRMGLAEAIDDLEWSRGFQHSTGKKPTDDDWKAWWMHNYGRDMRTDQERKRDKTARKGGPGRKLPRFRGQAQPEQRPPNYEPPVTYWR